MTDDPATGPGASLEFLIDEINAGSLAVLRWYKQEMSSQPYSATLEAEFNREADRIDVFDRLVTRHLINLLAVIKRNPLPALPGEPRIIPSPDLRESICQRGLAAMALLSSYYVSSQDQVAFYAKNELKLPPRMFRPDDQGVQETDTITQLMEFLWTGKWAEPSVVRPSAWLHSTLRYARGFREQKHKERHQDVDQLPEFQEHGYADTPAMWVSPRGQRVNPLDLQGDASLPVDAETDSAAAIRAAAGDDEEFGAVVHELLAGVSADSDEHNRLRGAPRVLDDPDTWRNIAARRGIPPGQRSHYSRDFKKRYRHRWYLLQRALWPYFRRSESPAKWGPTENKGNIVSKNLAQAPERSPRT